MKPGSRVACKLKLLFFFRVWGGGRARRLRRWEFRAQLNILNSASPFLVSVDLNFVIKFTYPRTKERALEVLCSGLSVKRRSKVAL